VDVLHEAVLRGLSGRLIAERRGTPVSTVHLMHGEIVGASGPDDDGWFVRRLVSNGALTERQGTALIQHIEQGGALPASLFDHVPPALHRALRTGRFRQKVLDFIQCDTPVRFRPEQTKFHDAAEHGHESTSLVEDLKALGERVASLQDRSLGPHRLQPGPAAPAGQDEARLLDLVDPYMGLHDLLTHSPFEAGSTLDLVRGMIERRCLVSDPPLRLDRTPAGPSAGPALEFAEELLFFDDTVAPPPAVPVRRPSDHDSVLGPLARATGLLSSFDDPAILGEMEPDPGDWGDGAPDHPVGGRGRSHQLTDTGSTGALTDGIILDDAALLDALIHEDEELLDALVHDDGADGLPEEPSLHQLLAVTSAGTTPQTGQEALIDPLGLDFGAPPPRFGAAPLPPVDPPSPALPPVSPAAQAGTPPGAAPARADVERAELAPSAELASAIRRAQEEEARRERARMSADYSEEDGLQAAHPPDEDASGSQADDAGADLEVSEIPDEDFFAIDREDGGGDPGDDLSLAARPTRTDLFDFGGDAEDEEMLMFQDHDRFRGAGQGQFTLAERLLDHVNLGRDASGTSTLPPPVEFPGGPSEGLPEDDDPFGLLAMGDAETASLTHADKVVALNFGAPRLELGDLTRKLEVTTEVTAQVSRALDQQLGPGAGQASIQLLLDGAPSAYAVVFQGLEARPDGTFDVSSAAGNIQRRPEGEHRRLIDSATIDLIERGLSYAVAELDDDAMDSLLESIAGYQQRLRA